ncbi:aspartic peptidase domain-containing protein [Trichoderma novae-zelandiae]
MRASPLAVAGVALASAAQAQVVQFDIEKRHSPRLSRRAGTLDGSLSNQRIQGGYFINVQVGSPGQNVTLQLDTGSSDVWVPSSNSAICTQVSQRNPGCQFGSFNPDDSDTFADVGQGLFDITYVDGSSSKGDYFQDNFQINGVTVKNLTMGLGLSSSIPNGLIGVGYINDEASVGTTRSTYPNLPVVLQQEKLINSVAFSLWLNDLDASTGSILFGGIDTEKYHGDLTSIDIISPNGGKTFTEFAVNLYSVQATSPSGTDTLSTSEDTLIAVLDSGTTLTYLPQDMAEEAWKEVGAEFNNELGLAVVPCSVGNANGFFSFTFAGADGPTINVTLSELVLDLFSGGPAPQFSSGPNKGQSICEFGIQNTTGAPFLLGDTFLRSTFVVYDLVNNQIALAPTNFNSTKTNVVAFASSGAPIPSATAAPNQSNTGHSSSTHSGMSAASGFHSDDDENAGSLTSVFSGPGMAVVGMTLCYTLLGGAMFGLGWL